MFEVKVGLDKDYHTVEEALQAVAYDSEALIKLDEGIYKEKLFFEKSRITLEGAGMEKTVISYSHGAKDLLEDGSKRGTFRSYTMFLGGKRVCLRDMKVLNSAGSGLKAGQALSIYADAERVFMERVCLDSCQDTLFMSPLPESVRKPGGFFGPRHLAKRYASRQYYKDCCIKGDVDFIFGGADAVFENCLIIVKNRDQEINGYVTAPCETPGGIGIIFKDCTIKGEDGIKEGSVFLGRPWRPSGRTVYINCSFDRSINEKRFSGWGAVDANEKEAYFGEYGSKDEEGKLMDLSNRNSFVRLLSDEEAGSFLKTAKEIKKDCIF
ncbi:MAG: pectin esterase [Lachnospiraceae bacterium]|nr:pectin esterase [Lachnospiraceae bacterium]